MSQRGPSDLDGVEAASPPPPDRGPRPPKALVYAGAPIRTPAPRPVASRLASRAIGVLGRLPLWLARAIGAATATVAAGLPLREAKATRVNLRIAFPEWSPARRRKLARRSLVETGKTFAECGKFWTCSREQLLRQIWKVSGEDHLRDAIDQRRGVILAVPHLGHWELTILWASTRYPVTVLYRPTQWRELDAFVRAGRERFCARLESAGSGAVRALYRALGRGELVAILPDQDSGFGQGVFVPFFGELANTMVLLPRLASRTRAPVLLASSERLPRGRGFHLRFAPGSEEIQDPDVRRSAAALNRDIERIVRRFPEQYLWSYKRFRTRPAGSPNPYETSASRS